MTSNISIPIKLNLTGFKKLLGLYQTPFNLGI